jgi:ABC-type glycerol-3-phosphate transport system substrate-binding protein
VPAQGEIAQQIFWYTAFTAGMTKPGLPVVNKDGTPKWRMAPSPHGPYWKEGMQNGYQDVGSWFLFKSTPDDRKAAAWLYAQFVTSKTVSLKKSIVGLTFIRDPTSATITSRKREQVRRPDRVLPQPGPRGVDADRQQRARLSEAGAAVVEERGHGHHGGKNAASRHG